jgi:hypothetical protein
MPFVLTTSGGGPTYGDTGTTGNSLAGGNFYWLENGDAKGHNIFGISDIDSRLGLVPPGGSAMSAQMKCAGTNGCHGDRSLSSETEAMLKSHHNNDMTEFKDGTSTAKSYRFLLNVKGKEDELYELQPTSGGHHNKYYGIDRTTEEQNNAGTISGLCAQCHGDYHNGSGEMAEGNFGAGVWIRHPVDFDMSEAVSSNEYSSYNGGSGSNNPYSVITPVATQSTDNTLNNTIYSQDDDAIVMCLSCHRAHGTPNDSLMRWDFKGWPGPNGYYGCGICHTVKD